MAAKKKSSSPKQTSAKKTTKKSSPKTASFREEIIVLITLAFSIILFIAIYFGSSAGKVGAFINQLSFKTMGAVSYIFPFYLSIVTLYKIANRKSKKVYFKLISSIVLMIVLASFLQVLVTTYDNSQTFREIIKTGIQMSTGGKISGGAIGSAVMAVFYNFFGKAGTIVVLVTLLIILFIFLAEKSFLELVKKFTNKTKQVVTSSYEEAGKLMDQTYEKSESPMERRRRFFASKDRSKSQSNVPLENEKDKENEKNKERTLPIVEPIIEGVSVKQETAKIDGNGDALEVETNVDPFIQLTMKTKTEQMGNQMTNQMGTVPNWNGGQVNDEFSGQGQGLNAQGVNGFGDGQGIGSQGLGAEHGAGLGGAGTGAGLGHGAGSGSGLGQRVNSQSVNSQGQRTNEHGTNQGRNGSGQGGGGQNKGQSGNSELGNINQTTTQQYIFPPIELLTKGEQKNVQSKQFYRDSALKLQQTLENFGVKVTVTHVSCGPAVTRYELQPEQGTKVSKIVSLQDDIKLNLEAADIRIEAPIPGKAAVGIEVPNKEKQNVLLRDIIESQEFKKFPSDLSFAVGKDVAGQVIVTDIAKMPHLLIAGATGSGKSVCINTLITSILYKAKPSDVKLIMIDPKVVELSVYNGIPHLLIPVVTDPKKASAALNWAVMEMTDRYKKFAEFNVRDLKGYNARVVADDAGEKLPQIIVIVDELADLMMVAPNEVEDSICRLAQMARAAGIHLVIATQRPSVNVITGLIKANIPSRIAFSVSSGVDSRTIIDMNGAEKLLGKGDMLFYPVGMQKPLRVQGAFITDKEVSRIVEFVGRNQITQYNETVINKIVSTGDTKTDSRSEQDEYFEDAARLVIEKDKASIGMIQRMFRVGFNRASRIMDQLEEAGVVGPEDGTKPRNIVMTIDQFEDYINL